MIEVIFPEGSDLKFRNFSEKFDNVNKIWIDVVNPTKEELIHLEENFNIPSNVIEESKSLRKRPNLRIYDKFLFLVAYGLRYHDNKLKHYDINFIFDKKHLITIHKEPIETFQNLKKEKNRIVNAMNGGLDHLLHTLLDTEVDNYIKEIEKAFQELNEIEEIILKRPDQPEIKKLFVIRRSLLNVKNVISYQREVLNNLISNADQFIRKDTHTYFRDVYDHILITIDLLEESKETASNILEMYLSSISNKLNEVMKVLTIIATIILPLTLISGIYGMNFKYMPEINWKYGYFFSLGLMAVIGFSMIIYFRRKKWL
ncbi:magnesium/cobalt transporter CorA [Candidatus Woesearchaeota archaeon]|nr:magnesium/cobalt transporter CorA [Candidatus Woesearchaeota archaeon]